MKFETPPTTLSAKIVLPATGDWVALPDSSLAVTVLAVEDPPPQPFNSPRHPSSTKEENSLKRVIIPTSMYFF
jgi:hypothetical protein